MIKHKFTKSQFISAINSVTAIIKKLEAQKIGMKHDILFCRVQADLHTLKELSRKMRSKQVSIEEKPDNHSFTYSVNFSQGFVVLYYRTLCTLDSYSMVVMESFSDKICKHLIS